MPPEQAPYNVEIVDIDSLSFAEMKRICEEANKTVEIPTIPPTREAPESGDIHAASGRVAILFVIAQNGNFIMRWPHGTPVPGARPEGYENFEEARSDAKKILEENGFKVKE